MEIVRTEGKRREKLRDENTTPPGDGATTRVLGGLVRQAHLDLYANKIKTSPIIRKRKQVFSYHRSLAAAPP